MIHFRLKILVVLYQSEINESITLNSLLNSALNFDNCELCIWNNGPDFLINKDISIFGNRGFSVKLIETIDNKSLSRIYNDFVGGGNGKAYMIVDDDSSLNDLYLEAIFNTSAYADILVPKVTSQSVQYSPFIRSYSLLNKIVIGITSGIVISDFAVEKLKDRFTSVFDEKFVFYGVDTSFFYRLHQADLAVVIIPGFEHRLSVFDDTESLNKKKWRAQEYTIAETLMLKYYLNGLYLFKILRLAIRAVIAIFNLLISNPNARSPLLMAKVFFSGRHPNIK